MVRSYVITGDLRAAASEAKSKSLRTLISHVEAHHAQAAKGLRQLAARYDYQAILEVLSRDLT